jgi:hypothetical protein
VSARRGTDVMRGGGPAGARGGCTAAFDDELVSFPRSDRCAQCVDRPGRCRTSVCECAAADGRETGAVRGEEPAAERRSAVRTVYGDDVCTGRVAGQLGRVGARTKGRFVPREGRSAGGARELRGVCGWMSTARAASSDGGVAPGCWDEWAHCASSGPVRRGDVLVRRAKRGAGVGVS